jgi:hypothetical protein
VRAMGGDLIVNSTPTDGHLTKIFCPGVGDFPFDIIQHVISVQRPWSLESRKPEAFYFLFLLRLCLLAFWNLNTVHSLDSGDKIYNAQTLFVALYIKC